MARHISPTRPTPPERLTPSARPTPSARSRSWRATPKFTGSLMVAGLLFIAACGDDGEMVADTRSSPAEESTDDDTGRDAADGDSAEGSGDSGADDVGAGTGSDECEDGPGRTVTPIEDELIPALHEPDLVVEDEQVGDVNVPGFTVPGVDFPETVIDTGCIVEFDAPGGCLGSVVITDTAIPERVIPGYEIPPVVAPDGEVLYEGAVQEEIVIDEVVIPGEDIDGVCQVEPDDEEGGTVWGVTRWGTTRWGNTQWGETRWGDTRARICDPAPDGDECTDRVRAPRLNVPRVRVERVRVERARLERYELEGSETPVLEDEDRTAYLAPADVLFEFDEAELGSDALPTLESIAEAIEADFRDDVAVSVDGHTDSHGEDDYNQDLSERRAQAVADWLVDEAGIDDDRIVTAGYGDTMPVAPNENDDGSDNPEGRAENRRVVISVNANDEE